MRALSVETGAARWVQALTRPAPRASTGGLLPAPLLVKGLLVVVGPEDTGLVTLSTRDGAVRWRHPARQVLGTWAREDTLYVTTRGGDVLALGLEDGRGRWKRTLPATLTSPPSVALGRLWVGTDEPALLALSFADGTEVDRRPLPAPLVTRVTESQSWMLVPTRSGAGWLWGFELQTKEPRVRLRLDTALLTRPVVTGPQLFVLGQDGRVQSWRLQAPPS